MSAHCHQYRRSCIALAGAALWACAVQAQPAPAVAGQSYPILEVTQKPLQLYQAPKISASSVDVAVPEGHKGKLGDGWRVLSVTPQFYEIQAGEHGHGFARRNAINVIPGSGIPAYCGPQASIPTEPTATTAGMGARCP